MSDILGGAIGADLGARFNGRRARKLAARSRLECALRVHPGRASTRRGGWTHGVADVSPGRLTFTPYLPSGLRLRNPFRATRVIDVVETPWAGEKVPTSFWGPGPGAVGVTVVSAHVTYQVAVVAAQAAWFVEAVTPGDRSAGP